MAAFSHIAFNGSLSGSAVLDQALLHRAMTAMSRQSNVLVPGARNFSAADFEDAGINLPAPGDPFPLGMKAAMADAKRAPGGKPASGKTSGDRSAAVVATSPTAKATPAGRRASTRKVTPATVTPTASKRGKPVAGGGHSNTAPSRRRVHSLDGGEDEDAEGEGEGDHDGDDVAAEEDAPMEADGGEEEGGMTGMKRRRFFKSIHELDPSARRKRRAKFCRALIGLMETYGVDIEWVACEVGEMVKYPTALERHMRKREELMVHTAHNAANHDHGNGALKSGAGEGAASRGRPMTRGQGAMAAKRPAIKAVAAAARRAGAGDDDVSVDGDSMSVGNEDDEVATTEEPAHFHSAPLDFRIPVPGAVALGLMDAEGGALPLAKRPRRGDQATGAAGGRGAIPALNTSPVPHVGGAGDGVVAPPSLGRGVGLGAPVTMPHPLTSAHHPGSLTSLAALDPLPANRATSILSMNGDSHGPGFPNPGAALHLPATSTKPTVAPALGTLHFPTPSMAGASASVAAGVAMGSEDFDSDVEGWGMSLTHGAHTMAGRGVSTGYMHLTIPLTSSTLRSCIQAAVSRSGQPQVMPSSHAHAHPGGHVHGHGEQSALGTPAALASGSGLMATSGGSPFLDPLRWDDM